jgi:hypothetical protein
MATSTAAKIEPQHPPLARDPQGNLLDLPDGTAAWRICRQTTGRPKEIVGTDKRAMRFPLETTADELADLCGADVYRVYALDEVGKVLDYVVTVDVTRESRELRNAAAPDTMLFPTLRTSGAGPSTDLRFALEAMAQMMRVNSEAMRAIAESQADWVKSIASARGFFRNAPPRYLLPEPTRDDEDEEEEDDEEPVHSKTIYDVLAPLAENLAPSVKPIVTMLANGGGNAPRNGATSAANKSDNANANLASKPGFELREFYDIKYAAAKAKAKKEAKPDEATPKRSLQDRVMSDEKLLSKFMAINDLLELDEKEKLLALGGRMNEEQQESLLAHINALSPENAVTWLRAVLVELDG